MFNYWNDLVLGSVQTYFLEVGAYVLWKEPPQVSERVIFAEFDWKYHIFLNIKTDEWDLKILLFNYWNDLVLGSVETYFSEINACVSLKRATVGVWDGGFCWIWLKISLFVKYKDGGVGPKNFFVELLKWSCLRLSRNIFFRSRCIRVCEKSHRECLRGWILLNLTGNITFF